MPWLHRLAGVLFLLAASHAHAWGQYGHVVICQIAYASVTDSVRARIDSLNAVHGEYASFNEACQWADRRPRKRSTEHYVNYPRDLEHVRGDGCGAAVRCVLSAIKTDLAILSDRDQSEAARASALVFLGHWVGDVHQPLHVSFADDRGGNRVIKSGRCQASNLHAVWDHCIVKRVILRYAGTVDADKVGKFGGAISAGRAIESALKPETVKQWQSADLAQWAD